MVEAVPLASSTQPSFDDRHLALAFGSRRIFEGIGIWGAIDPRVSPIRRIHISDRGRFGAARLEASEAGLPALGYVITARELGTVLHGMLDRQPNITLHCPVRVESVFFEDGLARVVVRRAERTEALSARLVVAADGADSPVREMAGITARRIDYGQSAIVTNVTPGLPHRDTAYERFTDSGPLAVLPAGPDRCAVVWSARSEQASEILAWDDDTFRARLQDRFGERLGVFGRVGRRRAYPLALTRVAEHVRPRLALIGNAAHTVHPVAGQGFNLGLRDVATLADLLLAGDGHDRDPGDYSLLARYADWRARDNRVTAGFTHSLIRIFSNDYLPVALARNAALVAIDLVPAIKRRFIRVTSGQSGRLPRLALGLPLSRSNGGGS
jgi:2-octaprenyl-6-methoxyphenol hydroxylase